MSLPRRRRGPERRGQDGGVTRAGYKVVLRAPGVRFLLATSLVARLPVAMVNLAIILRVAHGTGSYGRAGAVTASFVLGTALGSPALGRLADTLGRRPVLVTASLGNTAGLVALALVPVGDSLPLFLLAAATGLSLPPVAPAVRSLWRHLVPAEQTSSLYAIDATLQEVTFMVGPALVALSSTLASPGAALVLSGVFGLAGTLAVTTHPATAGRSDPHRHTSLDGVPRPRARTPALNVLSLTAGFFLTAIAAVEVAVVAFAGRHHDAHQAGLLLVLWSAGSLLGGLLFGSRVAHAGASAVAPLMATAGMGFALLVSATGVGPLYALLFLAGSAIAPGFSLLYDLVGRTAAPSVSVEAFSWVASALQLGASAGAALGGVLVDAAGPSLSFAVGGGIALVASMVALLGSRVVARAVVESTLPALAD